MGKAGKATKKFQKNHLSDAIKTRRKQKNVAKWRKARAEPKNGKTRDPSHEKDKDEEIDDDVAGKPLEEMDVEEFLSSGFNDIADDAEEEEDEEEADLDAGKDENESDVELPEGVFEEIDTSDDDEESDEGTLKANNRMLQAKASSHKKDLEALKTKDPEFYKYLQEMDKELLDFEDSDMEEGDDDATADDAAPAVTGADGAGEEGDMDTATGADVERKVITTSMVTAWCAAAKEQHKLGALRNVLRAYRSACHYGDSESDSLASEYSIGSSHVFNKVMVFALKEMDGIFRTLLGMSVTGDSAAGNFNLEKRPRWKKMEPLIKSYLGNSLHVLTQMTDPDMIAFTLRRLGASTDFFGPFERLTRKTLRAVLDVFAGGDSADNARLRVSAFLFVRRLAVSAPEYLDQCLRGVYRTYASSAKFTTAASGATVSFMADCVVELFGLDLNVSYDHIFVALRQLAVLLRSALTTKEKESFRAVYCWQAVWCMEVWTRVLVAYADREELKPLVYPLVQIVTGAARLLPAARYLPLRLRLVRMLNRLAAATGKFVPVSSMLLEVLKFKELSKSPQQAGAGKPPDFASLLKVSKATVRTPAFQMEVIQQAMELLSEHLNQWAYSPGFPELLHVPLVALRAFIKQTNVERFRKQARALVDVAERQADWVKAKRNLVDFAPKDTAAVQAFMGPERAAQQGPLSKHAAQLKLNSIQRQSMHRTSSVQTVETGKASKRKTKDVDSEGDDDDDEADGSKAFGGTWMPSKTEKKKEKLRAPVQEKDVQVSDDENANMGNEDKLVDVELSSDEDDEGDMDEDFEADEVYTEGEGTPQRPRKSSKKPGKSRNSNSRSPSPGGKRKAAAGKGGKKHLSKKRK